MSAPTRPASSARRAGSVAKATAKRHAAELLKYRLARPLRASRRPGALVVLHTARCGSTVLTRLLDQHPRIHSDGEMYLPVLPDRAGDPLAADFDPIDYLERRLPRSGSRWFLFDVQFDHIERMGRDLEDYLRSARAIGVTRIVVLRRSNLLRKITSNLLAQQRGRWHLPKGANEPARTVDVPDGPFMIDGITTTLLGHLDRVDGWYDRARQLDVGVEIIELTYEADIMADPLVGYRRVLEFVGLPHHPAAVPTERLNTRPLGDVLGNHAEVASWLAGSRYEWMLDE